MSSSAFQRKLDFAPTASIDKVALNNKVVLMRAVVRRAKLHTINSLVKKIQKLRNKKGTENQQNQNKSRADRLLEEIKIIKILKPDYVSKYALGSTEQFKDLVAKPSTTIDMRALARLAEQKFIQGVVEKFRAEHDDWKELAAYLMTKHTSREFKKKKTIVEKKTKEKMKKVETNMKASETLVQKFLGEKLKESHDVESDDNDDDEDASGTEERAIGIEKQTVRKQQKVKIRNLKRQRNMLKGNLTVVDNINENSEEDIKDTGEDGDNFSPPSDSDNASAVSDEEIIYSNIVESENDEDDNDNNDDDNTDDSSDAEEDSGHVSDNSPIKSDKKALQLKAEKSRLKPEKSESRNMSVMKRLSEHRDMETEESSKRTGRNKLLTEKVEGEMIVKKLDLRKNDDDDGGDEIPAVLLSHNNSSPVKRRRKRMDVFFDTGEEYDIDTHNDVVMTNEMEDDNLEVNDTEKNNDRKDKGSIQPAISAFTTCFVGSLKSSDMMAIKDSHYRSNEDWKRLRHEAKEQKMGRGRGIRGRGATFRGRGSLAHPQRGGGRGRGFDRSEGSTFRGGRGHESGKVNTPAEPQKEKGLHPSWEASKKRKQEQKGILQAFAGKKVKFDD